MAGFRLPAALSAVLLLAAMAAGEYAAAQTSSPALEASRNRLTEFVAANPGCKEMSDNCQVCVVASRGAPECSTPGIACMPAAWQCRKQAETVPDSNAKPKR